VQEKRRSAPESEHVSGQSGTRQLTLPRVLFMVIEKFKRGDLAAVGERFVQQGRMLPDGVSYEVSWLDEAGTLCFQVMSAPDRATLDVWIARWSDLVDFEVVPVLTSQEFWALRQR
jgi:hypothetical protein